MLYCDQISSDIICSVQIDICRRQLRASGSALLNIFVQVLKVVKSKIFCNVSIEEDYFKYFVFNITFLILNLVVISNNPFIKTEFNLNDLTCFGQRIKYVNYSVEANFLTTDTFLNKPLRARMYATIKICNLFPPPARCRYKIH